MNYSFKAKIWKTAGKGGWHFVTLPQAITKKIRKNHFDSEEGWGRLKTIAQINTSKWNTAIWYDTKKSAYLLPIKSEIRKKQSLVDGSSVTVNLLFED